MEKYQLPPTLSEFQDHFFGQQEPCPAAPGEQPETSTTSDSVGIDLPGVGVLRPAGVSSDCAGRERAVGGASLTDPAGSADEPVQERRERLFSELVFAARDLALAQIEPADGGGDPAFCTECVIEEHAGVIAHERGCRTGRVLEVIADLVRSLHADCSCSRSDLIPKEEAGGEEKPAAGDRIRPRELALQAIDHLLCRVRDDARLAYYFDPLGRSMELLTAARAEMCGDDLEAFRARYYALLKFEAPRCRECGGAQ